jgi:hypothetical protein
VWCLLVQGQGDQTRQPGSSEQGTPLDQACHWFEIGTLESLLEVVSDQVTVLASVLCILRTRDFRA